MKISIITPCFNAEKYIEETMESVLNQSAVINNNVDLEYVIVDGNSTDNTLEIAMSFKSDCIKIISESDSGMYDALAKGLRLISGDIVAYINAGDYYSKQAFDIVAEIFLFKKEVLWLTGINCSYNYKSQLVGFRLPYKYNRSLIRKGMYGTVLPFIQQESTFWRSDLNRYLDLVKLSRFKLAGDFYIWKTFSEISELCIVEAYLGGFKHHSGRLSENMKQYLGEMIPICSKRMCYDYFLAYLYKVLWHAPAKVKKNFNPNNLFRYDHYLKEWI